METGNLQNYFWYIKPMFACVRVWVSSDEQESKWITDRSIVGCFCFPISICRDYSGYVRVRQPLSIPLFK